jgi:hypothetical protein
MNGCNPMAAACSKRQEHRQQAAAAIFRTGPADAEAKRINTAERTRTTRIHGGQTSRDEERLDSRSFETTNILVSKHRGDQNEWQQPWCRRQHHGHLFVDRKEIKTNGNSPGVDDSIMAIYLWIARLKWSVNRTGAGWECHAQNLEILPVGS